MNDKTGQKCKQQTSSGISNINDANIMVFTFQQAHSLLNEIDLEIYMCNVMSLSWRKTSYTFENVVCSFSYITELPFLICVWIFAGPIKTFKFCFQHNEIMSYVFLFFKQIYTQHTALTKNLRWCDDSDEHVTKIIIQLKTCC